MTEDLRNLIRVPFTDGLGGEKKAALFGIVNPVGNTIACTDHRIGFFEIQVRGIA